MQDNVPGGLKTSQDKPKIDGAYGEKFPPIGYYLYFPFRLPHNEMIHSETMMIGRTGDIVLSAHGIENYHCSLTVKDHTLALKDLGSNQGTFLNGVKIAKHKMVLLKEDDQIEIGAIKFYVKKFEPNQAQVQKTKIKIESPKPTIYAHPKVDAVKVQKILEPQVKELEKKEEKEPMVAHASIRLLSLIADIILAVSLTSFLKHTLYFDFIHSIQIFLKSQTDALFSFSLILRTIADTLIQWGGYFLSFMIIRVVSASLLGVSPSQYLMGMTSDSSKSKSVIREIIGFVTFHFLVFDISSLFSQKTFKEFLSGSILYSAKKPLRLISGTLFTFFFALSSLYFSQIITSGSVFSQQKLQIIYLTQNILGNSSASEIPDYNIAIMTSDFKIFPFYYLSQNSDSKKIKLKYKTLIGQNVLEIEPVKHFSWENIYKLLKDVDPFWEAEYPNLKKEWPQYFQASEKLEENVQLSAIAQAEFEKLAQKSIGLNFMETLRSFSLKGFFWESEIEFKRFINSILDNSQTKNDIFFWKGLAGNFMGVKKSVDELIFFPVAAPGTLYHLTCKDCDMNKVMENIVVKMDADIVSLENKQSNMNQALHTLLKNQKITSTQAQELMMKVVNFYTENARSLLVSGADSKMFYQSLKNIIETIKVLYIRDAGTALSFEGDTSPVTIHEELYLRLVDIETAFRMGNKDFFTAAQTTLTH